jgi:hypothetical protein
MVAFFRLATILLNRIPLFSKLPTMAIAVFLT